MAAAIPSIAPRQKKKAACFMPRDGVRVVDWDTDGCIVCKSTEALGQVSFGTQRQWCYPNCAQRVHVVAARGVAPWFMLQPTLVE